jgi:uncharacterized protein YnzC (UPF0291/DUF896 family)
MTEHIKLSEKEINDQKAYAQKYLDLINKELGYGDLVSLENVSKYTQSFKYHSKLAKEGFVTI